MRLGPLLSETVYGSNMEKGDGRKKFDVFKAILRFRLINPKLHHISQLNRFETLLFYSI